MKLLINAGADVNIRGNVSLSQAISYDCVNIADALLYAGADVNATGPLIVAA